MNYTYTLNKTEGFDPYQHVDSAVSRRGEPLLKKDGTPLKYLATAAKVVWFRKVYPKGAIIVSEVTDTPVKDFGDIVRYKASIYLDVNDTRPVAEWQHQETCWDVAEMDNIVSKVQTIAVGKALSKAGFGCEIEMELGALSEGEECEDTVSSDSSTEKPTPKKRRGRPKKEVSVDAKTETVDNTEKEVEDMLRAAEAENSTPVIEPKEPELSDADKLKQAMATKLACAENATNEKIRNLEGQTLEEIINQRPSFCNLVQKNPNISSQLTSETVAAAVYIAEHR